MATPTLAGQVDIVGPPGSWHFGRTVRVLPNGNIVVTNPTFASSVGAVYLYGPDGTLISTPTGSNAGDSVGLTGVTSLGNGDFVVSSVYWNGRRGAVTWVNGTTGLNGEGVGQHFAGR